LFEQDMQVAHYNHSHAARVIENSFAQAAASSASPFLDVSALEAMEQRMEQRFLAAIAANIPAKKDTKAAKSKRPIYYCWTHGGNFTHASAKCNVKAPGHQPTATMTNKMGGNAYMPSA